MKKIVEALVEADLITSTNSDWAVLSMRVPKKCGTYCCVVGYAGLNNQVEKTY